MSPVAPPQPRHVPVMLDRVVSLLVDAPDGVVVDCTVGAGGHAAALLRARHERGRETHLIGIDRDPSALDLATAALDDAPGSYELVHARSDDLGRVLDGVGVDEIGAALLDLGISSMHVDDPSRGFSYRHEGPLDMRMDPTAPRTAADIVNDADLGELTSVIGRYGEERFAGRIARAVVAARPITTTTELATIVRDAIPAAARRSGPHPATRTFQALRIAVNDELGALERTLPTALERLRVDGVCVVLAYHSLEDRLVKDAFREATTGCICPPDLPVCGCGRRAAFARVGSSLERPSEEEIGENPRARSARLRAVRRVASSTRGQDAGQDTGSETGGRR